MTEQIVEILKPDHLFRDENGKINYFFDFKVFCQLPSEVTDLRYNEQDGFVYATTLDGIYKIDKNGSFEMIDQG